MVKRSAIVAALASAALLVPAAAPAQADEPTITGPCLSLTVTVTPGDPRPVNASGSFDVWECLPPITIQGQ